MASTKKKIVIDSYQDKKVFMEQLIKEYSILELVLVGQLYSNNDFETDTKMSEEESYENVIYNGYNINEKYMDTYKKLLELEIDEEEYQVYILIDKFQYSFVNDALPRFYAIAKIMKYFKPFIKFIIDFSKLKINQMMLVNTFNFDKNNIFKIITEGSNEQFMKISSLHSIYECFSNYKNNFKLTKSDPILNEIFSTQLNKPCKNLILTVSLNSRIFISKAFTQQVTECISF